MNIRVPIMVQDQVTALYMGMDPAEQFEVKNEPFFLDGPTVRQVAVLDFDPNTGALLPGAPFLPPSPGREEGGYLIANPGDPMARDFNLVSVFGSVMRTKALFEDEDTLGRPLTWAFGAPQLLIVPRAGNWANAYYERESRSLQFFFFPVASGSPTIYTSLSHDIVSHESAHAILDGIVPDLYNAITPQSLALREAVADLTAATMAFLSPSLRRKVLDQTQGSIHDSTAFSSVAEEFGRAVDPVGRAGYLRTLVNDKTLDSEDDANRVSRSEPHDLSQVLSGALYAVMVRMHDAYKHEYSIKESRSEFEVSGKALWVAAQQFKRMIFRALDYLPPGEVSFADYGRAILAADQASHAEAPVERNWIRDEFIRRRMSPSLEALEVETNVEHPALAKVDLQTLVESDWAAYEFANRNLLRVPVEIPLRVRPRLDVTKSYYTRHGQKQVRECLFKVSWDRKELNRLGARFPRERQITAGTTLAIDWATRVIRARLSTDAGQEQQDDRDRLLDRLADEGRLALDREAFGPHGQLLRTVVRAESMNGLARMRGTARMLHIALEGA